MSRVAILFGVLLIALGLVGYLSPETLGKLGPKGNSPTALIPAGVGAVLLLCGLIVEFAPGTRKHVMHLAAVVGLVGAVGGFMPIKSNNADFSMAGAVSGVLMVVLCALFVVLCIRSFVLARIARHEGLPDEAYAEEKRSRQKPTGA
jgi:nitrate/nitrite transporter NarK